MTFLPILAREIRVASRRPGTYWSRVAAAGLAILVVGWISETQGLVASSARVGQTVFGALVTVGMFFAGFSGVRNTADCISVEKREGTLGLLFLTHLKGHDVAVGKLAATSLNAFYGLLAFLPILAIPLLLGGVPPDLVARMALVLLNTMFFSLTCCMLISTLAKDERRAVGSSVLVLLLFSAGLPLADVLIREVVMDPPRRTIFSALYYPNPVFQVWTAWDASKGGKAFAFWQSVGTVHCLGWMFFLATCLLLPRVWTDKAESVGRQRFRERWKQWCYGDSASRAGFRHRLASINPVYWLTSRDRIQPTLVWALLAVTGVLWLWGWLEVGREWLDSAVHVMTALFLHSAVKWWLALEASQALGDDRRNGALELLLSTPLKVKGIVHGVFLSLRRKFGWPVVAILLVDFVFLLTDVRNGEWVLLCVVGMVALVADLIALAWLSVWLSLSATHVSRAAGRAAGRLLMAPWLVFIMLITVLEMMRFRTEWEEMLLLWLGIGLAFDAAWYAYARIRLLREFRAVATQRFQPPVSWWKRVFGGGA